MRRLWVGKFRKLATLSDSHLLPARQARRGEATRTRVDPRMKHAPPGDGPDLLLIFLLQSAVGRLQVSLHQVANSKLVRDTRQIK